MTHEDESTTNSCGKTRQKTKKNRWVSQKNIFSNLTKVDTYLLTGFVSSLPCEGVMAIADIRFKDSRANRSEAEKANIFVLKSTPRGVNCGNQWMRDGFRRFQRWRWQWRQFDRFSPGFRWSKIVGSIQNIPGKKLVGLKNIC